MVSPLCVSVFYHDDGDNVDDINGVAVIVRRFMQWLCYSGEALIPIKTMKPRDCSKQRKDCRQNRMRSLNTCRCSVSICCVAGLRDSLWRDKQVFIWVHGQTQEADWEEQGKERGQSVELDKCVKTLNRNGSTAEAFYTIGKYISDDVFVSMTASHSSQSWEISLSGLLFLFDFASPCVAFLTAYCLLKSLGRFHLNNTSRLNLFKISSKIISICQKWFKLQNASWILLLAYLVVSGMLTKFHSPPTKPCWGHNKLTYMETLQHSVSRQPLQPYLILGCNRCCLFVSRPVIEDSITVR